MVIFDSVTKRFGNRTILQDINLEIKPGEFVSIVGSSGAGKTTLIKLILGMEHPSEGAVFIDNATLHSFNREQLQQHRRTIGTVFQDYKLLPNKTVFENVAFELEACDYILQEILERVPKALESVGVLHLQDQYPHELSGGEAQRVSLARAIAHRPRLILADEPTGNLDLENAKAVAKELMKINMGGTAVILTTHNRPLVNLIGQKVVYLENGSIISK